MTDTEQAAAGTEAFARRFLAHAGSQLPNRTASQLRELARETFEFGRTRAPGRTLIRTSRTGADTATLDVITDDARFLVESVLVELERSGADVEHVLHPQIVVRRDAEGRIEHVFDIDDSAEVPAGAEVESWTRVEFGDIATDQLPGLVERMHQVLDDVHAAMADTSRMYQLMRALADQLADNPGDFDREASEEGAHLLRWLADGNYLITGHACYAANDLASGSATGERTTGTNDGVLRNSSRISPMELLPAFRSGAPIVIFKSPLVSRIRRSVRYDCVTVVTPAAGSEPQKVHVFLGLLTSAEDGNVARVPGVRRRISEILLRSGARADSHTGRLLMAALRTLPRDELLEAPTGDLLRLAQLVVDRGERRTVGVFARVHLNRDFVGVLVYFPADRFGPEVRRRVVDLINEYWPGEVIGRDDRIVEMNLARMQILIQLRPGTQPPKVDRAEVEAKVAKVTRRWSDDLSDLLTLSVGEQEATRLTRRYRGALPEAYKEDFDASTAAADLVRLEELPPENGLAFTLYTPESPDEGDRRLKVYRTGRSVSLARALPIFTHMGIEVLDERPYEIDLDDGHPVWIYDFGLRLPAGVDLDGPAAATMVDALGRLWREELERDGFNALVVGAGMTWWQANVLRAYAKYLRQTGATYSQGYIEETLAENPRIARALVELFEARFDPSRAGEPTTAITEDIDARLADVASLDHDRILRALLTLVSATVRTNAYRTDTIGAVGEAPDSGVEANRRVNLAFKLDPRLIPDLPQPRPRHEVWVYSPRVEGVHLRFGAVARGGLRWSDRREDFRTEVLGLVKAQMVKNAVIVPVGAKGGFVAKAAPDPSADRDAWLAEGISAYRTFISALLDITDNLQLEGGEQKIVPPPQVRRYDGDDTYLVVAADKGTATFSDIANGIAVDYGFWLGDAFASGGSAGYDHKAMGITARGAWESVKYHFRELGINTQEQDFTVVGVGDMSGDVFGNGMLLSEHIRLVAAFDHRHIFIDPDPDAATSYAERRRLFDLPRSSWADYDPTLISEGGGVYPRTVKSIPITEQARIALGLPDGTVKLTPNELMHAILLAPVDLLWNGGIGTYVKATDEPQAAAGDKANDAIRVDGAQLRCRVVGEGGNLGLTQLGRVEFALNGGRINTDAIDNSAGVDTSDHEVNIKILLDRAVATGELSPGQRNEMLAAATDEVAHLVLRDNYLQNVMLGMARSTRPGPGLGPPPDDHVAGEVRRPRPGHRVPAARSGAGRPRGRRAGPDLARARGAGRVRQDHPDPRHRRLDAAGRGLVRAGPGRLLPARHRVAASPARSPVTRCTARSPARPWSTT